MPADVSHLLVELWGAGGGGAAGQSVTGGAGGGGGAYARLVLDVTPGAVINIVTGAGGAGLLASPGQQGSATQLFLNGSFIASAFGGKGGNGSTGGLGGGCDLGIASVALCRPGYPGAPALDLNGTPGGRAAIGTIEPLGAAGGNGAPGNAGPNTGVAGLTGYALLSW